MTPALNSLSQRIAARLSSSQRDDHYLHNDFHALASAALDMEKRFDKAEKIPLSANVRSKQPQNLMII
ncbi:hypothetical protein IGX55_001350 [Escherichia coli]|nr:hypothetical protein [Escherichia coli]